MDPEEDSRWDWETEGYRDEDGNWVELDEGETLIRGTEGGRPADSAGTAAMRDEIYPDRGTINLGDPNNIIRRVVDPREAGGRDPWVGEGYNYKTGVYEQLNNRSDVDKFFGIGPSEKELLELARQQYFDDIWRRQRELAPGVDELAWEAAQEGTEDEFGSLLSSKMDEYGDLLGGPSEFDRASSSEAAQQRALDEMMGLYESGGWTDADRNRQAANRQMVAQQMGAANQAALQQARARGMTGSGALLAQQAGNAQGMANAQMMQDAQMQQAAMGRALNALGAYQSGAGQMRNQDQARRAALDEFNRANMDWRRDRSQGDTAWRRGREERNTAARSQTAENRANAAQQHWKNQFDANAQLTERGYASPAGGQSGLQQAMAPLAGLAELF
tara:strand:- start:1423 stop:2589 length:1167 start_codon:yes stop_codon:yes gene_type:complete